MESQQIDVARTIGDLSGLPLGTRIATNHNRLLICDKFAGGLHWYEQGELILYQPLVHWLPAFILPPVVDHKADL
jgi:hypothetical protein